MNDEAAKLAFAALLTELRRAHDLHPLWPTDPYRVLAIIGEELGEAQQAALDATYHGQPWSRYEVELVQVGAMVLRALMNSHASPSCVQP